MENYNWRLYPVVEEFLIERVESLIHRSKVLENLAERMRNEASLRLFDWIDHIILPHDDDIEDVLIEFGFKERKNLLPVEKHPEGYRVYTHSGSIFFPILISENSVSEIVIKPENLDHFLQMYGKRVVVDGEPFAAYRKAEISSEKEFSFSAVERNGYRWFNIRPGLWDDEEYVKVQDVFFRRLRNFLNDDEGMEDTLYLIKEQEEGLWIPRVCNAFFKAERRYWESRDRVGQIQRNRQDRLGLGWGNHDHHTYRSSRENFSKLIEILETLGFTKREQFFAGQKAGWGAQVLEHPDCNITIFADVDISDEERGKDFTKEVLSDLDSLGTVGMWVGLHGESILQAGLHHLAARVDYEDIRISLPKYCADAIKPFSYFKFLKQSFTVSERRPINPDRLDSLFKKNQVSEEGKKMFLDRGAIGSHLEIIQRNQGFKGFNQDSVTAIIQATDPRLDNE